MTTAMIRAELLKLRRNRGLMALAFGLSAGVTILMFGYGAIQHATSPANHPPAGGVNGFDHTVRLLGEFFGLLAAAVIGGEAGAADIAGGVFRDLVATGRSRLALFAVRAPAAIALSWVVAATGYAIGLIATFALAGNAPTPSLSTIIDGALWIALANSAVAVLGVAVGSISGSRALTLTGVIGWELVASNILLNTRSLGSVRDAVLNGALLHFIPVDVGREASEMAGGTAAAVIALWVLVALGLGAWRTLAREA